MTDIINPSKVWFTAPPGPQKHGRGFALQGFLPFRFGLGLSPVTCSGRQPRYPGAGGLVPLLMYLYYQLINGYVNPIALIE